MSTQLSCRLNIKETDIKYSKRLKSSVIRKVLPTENQSVPAVAKEMGIAEQTIYNWKNQAFNGILNLGEDAASSVAISAFAARL